MNIEKAFDFQIGIEERISKIYQSIQSIAHQFSAGLDHDTEEGVAFWKELAMDESNHAALLSAVKGLLQADVRAGRGVEIDPKTREELDLLLSGCEERIHPGITEKEAFQILVTVETSEANRLFFSLLKATDSKVVAYFAVFSQALKRHEERIQQGILKACGPGPVLAPYEVRQGGSDV